VPVRLGTEEFVPVAVYSPSTPGFAAAKPVGLPLRRTVQARKVAATWSYGPLQ